MWWKWNSLIIGVGLALAAFGEGPPEALADDPVGNPDWCCVGGRPYTQAEKEGHCTKPCSCAGCNPSNPVACWTDWLPPSCVDIEDKNCDFVFYPAGTPVGGYLCTNISCGIGICWDGIYTKYRCTGAVTTCASSPADFIFWDCKPGTECGP